MKKEFTCIVCPNGCGLTADVEDGKIISITGAGCRRGEEYVTQELTAPKRTIASSVTVVGGTLPLASVRTETAIPKERIFDAMAEIRKITLTAPVKAGTVVIENLLGTGAKVIVTKNVPEK